MDDYTVFRFEMQHIFPIEIFGDFPNLAEVGLTVQMQGNLMALLSNPETVAAALFQATLAFCVTYTLCTAPRPLLLRQNIQE